MTFRQVGSIQASSIPSSRDLPACSSHSCLEDAWCKRTENQPHSHHTYTATSVEYISLSLPTFYPSPDRRRGTERQIGASDRMFSSTWIDHLPPFLDPQDRNKVKCFFDNQSTNLLLTNHDWSPTSMRGSITTSCPPTPYTQYNFQPPRWPWLHHASFIDVSLKIHTFLLPQKSITLDHRIKRSRRKDHIIGSTITWYPPQDQNLNWSILTITGLNLEINLAASSLL